MPLEGQGGALRGPRRALGGYCGLFTYFWPIPSRAMNGTSRGVEHR